MARARIGLVLNRAAIADIMKSSELGKVCQDVSQDIADSAGSDKHTAYIDYARRKSRVIGLVVSSDIGYEIQTGALARAVTARTEPWQK